MQYPLVSQNPKMELLKSQSQHIDNVIYNLQLEQTTTPSLKNKKRRKKYFRNKKIVENGFCCN